MQNVLITDGGPHPAEKWAEATASHIVDIAEHVGGARRGAAVKLQAAVIDILEGHHHTIQNGERGKIKEHKLDRLTHDIDPEHHLSVDEVVAEIVAAAAGTPWEADFNYPGQVESVDPDGTHHPAINSMAQNLKELLTQHFATSIHVERSWHADRNPGTEQATAFHAKHNLRTVDGGAA